jgi:uncharacterized peroxidase-related enzyme
MVTSEHPQGDPRENTVRLVTEEDATGRVQELYEEVKASREGDLDEELSLSKLWLLFGNDPELLEIFRHHVDYTYNRGSLPFELKSKISLVVATVMECEGCTFFHESALEHIDVEEEAIQDIKELEIRETGFSAQEELILHFTQKATEDPYSITDADLEALRNLGLTEQEIFEIFDCIAFHVYTAVLQGISGIVYPGMSREEWTSHLG